jgi:hypothetical protein
VLFAICKAQLRCTWRRVDAAFVAAPVLVGAAALGIAALPALAVWGGARAAPALRTADPSTLALGAGLVAALAGAVLTLLAPGRRALGTQLEPAPVPRVTAFVGLTLLPPAAALALLAVPAAFFVAPAAGRSSPLVLARLLGAAAAGAAAAEAALALARRSLRGVPVVAGLVLLLFGWRNVAVVPFAVALWVAAAAVRPDERAERASVRVLGRGHAATTLLRYARRRELRRQAAAAFALALGGAVALRATGVPNQVTVFFGGATALLGAAVVPLAAPGIDRRAEWLWRSAPVARAKLAFVHGVIALVLGLVLAAIGVAGSLAVAPVKPTMALPLAAGAVVVLGAALLAGAIVPWRSDRLAEQLGAYATFGVVLSALWFALARAAPFVGAGHGARAAALAGAGLAFCVVAAVAVTGMRR